MGDGLREERPLPCNLLTRRSSECSISFIVFLDRAFSKASWKRLCTASLPPLCLPCCSLPSLFLAATRACSSSRRLDDDAEVDDALSLCFKRSSYEGADAGDLPRDLFSSSFLFLAAILASNESSLRDDGEREADGREGADAGDVPRDLILSPSALLAKIFASRSPRFRDDREVEDALEFPSLSLRFNLSSYEGADPGDVPRDLLLSSSALLAKIFASKLSSLFDDGERDADGREAACRELLLSSASLLALTRASRLSRRSAIGAAPCFFIFSSLILRLRESEVNFKDWLPMYQENEGG